MRLQNLTNAAEKILRKAHQAGAKNQKQRFDGVPLLDLWEGVVKEADVSKIQKESMIADFYTELLQDQRFINLGNNKWKLREFVPFEEYKRIKGAMYGIENLERIEEENRTKEIPDNGKEDIIEAVEEPIEDDLTLVPSDNEDGE